MKIACHILVVIIVTLLVPSSVRAEEWGEDPYELEAPNGGELVKYPTGEYVLHVFPPVKITHGSLIMNGDDGWIYRNEQKAVLKGNVTIYDNEQTLFADVATYYKTQKKIVLKGNVIVNDLERNLQADEVIIWRERQFIEVKKNVIIEDFKDNITLKGNHATYRIEDKIAIFDQKPILLLTKDDKVIDISADTLLYFSREKKAVAKSNVMIHETRSEAYCENAILSQDRNSIELMDNPVIVYEDSEAKSELKGDKITIHYEDNQLTDVIVDNSAIALHHPKAQESQNQTESTNLITGDKMMFYFDDKAIEQVVVYGGARSIYYPETKSPDRPERNDVTGKQISIFLKKGKVDIVEVNGDSQGIYAFPQEINKKKEE